MVFPPKTSWRFGRKDLIRRVTKFSPGFHGASRKRLSRVRWTVRQSMVLTWMDEVLPNPDRFLVDPGLLLAD